MIKFSALEIELLQLCGASGALLELSPSPIAVYYSAVREVFIRDAKGWYVDALRAIMQHAESEPAFRKDIDNIIRTWKPR